MNHQHGIGLPETGSASLARVGKEGKKFRHWEIWGTRPARGGWAPQGRGKTLAGRRTILERKEKKGRGTVNGERFCLKIQPEHGTEKPYL